MKLTSQSESGKSIPESVLPSEKFDIHHLSQEVKAHNQRRSVLLEHRKTLRGRSRSNSPLALMVTPSKDTDEKSKLHLAVPTLSPLSSSSSLPQSPNTTIKIMEHSAITNANMASLMDETYARLNREKIINLESSFVNLNKNFV